MATKLLNSSTLILVVLLFKSIDTYRLAMQFFFITLTTINIKARYLSSFGNRHNISLPVDNGDWNDLDIGDREEMNSVLYIFATVGLEYNVSHEPLCQLWDYNGMNLWKTYDRVSGLIIGNKLILQQVFLAIFTISITFPMQLDFNSPKFFPPNFLQPCSPKCFIAKVLYCMVYSIFWCQCTLTSNNCLLYVVTYSCKLTYNSTIDAAQFLILICRGEAIMLVKLSIILFSNSHNFTYYAQNYS